jgi:hypothetical protein
LLLDGVTNFGPVLWLVLPPVLVIVAVGCYLVVLAVADSPLADQIEPDERSDLDEHFAAVDWVVAGIGMTVTAGFERVVAVAEKLGIAGSVDWKGLGCAVEGVEALAAATAEEYVAAAGYVEAVAKESQLEKRMDLAAAGELRFVAALTVGEVFPAEQRCLLVDEPAA